MRILEMTERDVRSACYVVCLTAGLIAPAYSQTAKIVGLGASQCANVIADVRRDPAIRRDYLAWAQGFMSGLLLTRPAGVDEALNLLPPSFPPGKQLDFLLDFCNQHPTDGFSDATEALYKKLRRENLI